MDTKVRWLLPVETQLQVPIPEWRIEAQRLANNLASQRTARGYADASLENIVIFQVTT